MQTADEILRLLEQKGNSQYGGEAVTQIQHALQAATLAELQGADAHLITAALLHDVGHLLHNLPDHAPDEGIDDRHETSASNYLRKIFPDSVVEPIRMHVDAKRYLCAADPTYQSLLSEPSIVSLRLQGGPMTDEQVKAFQERPYFEDAIRLRRWDDEAKDPHLTTKPLSHFAPYVRLSESKDRS